MIRTCWKGSHIEKIWSGPDRKERGKWPLISYVFRDSERAFRYEISESFLSLLHGFTRVCWHFDEGSIRGCFPT